MPGRIEETTNPTTEYVGPARVVYWEVTRRRDESVVHRQFIKGE